MSVIITGANGGLGKALVSVLGNAGCDLILHRRSEKKDYIVPEGTIVDEVYGELRLLTPLNTIVEIAKRRHVDVLINNAAEYLNKPFDTMTDCDIREIIETNLISPMTLTRKLWSVLVENNGLVVNINSIAGREGGKYETAYSASKYGLAGFSSSLQFDGTKDGVSVTDVFVGKMITKMTEGQVNQDKYIDPLDVAKIIYSILEQPRSCRINEITITRKNY